MCNSVTQVVQKIVEHMGLDPARAALAIAVALEYAKRTGSLKKGLKLCNHCSKCHLKGHNAVNHTREIDTFLKDRALDNDAQNASDALNAAGM